MQSLKGQTLNKKKRRGKSLHLSAHKVLTHSSGLEKSAAGKDRVQDPGPHMGWLGSTHTDTMLEHQF